MLPVNCTYGFKAAAWATIAPTISCSDSSQGRASTVIRLPKFAPTATKSLFRNGRRRADGRWKCDAYITGGRSHPCCTLDVRIIFKFLLGT